MTLQALGLLLLFPAVGVSSTDAGLPPAWFPNSWYFDWTPQGAPLPIPTTAQCETIHIAWERGTATGPDGTAPYYLQIYTSNYIFPFVIPTGLDPHMDVTIPFAPGTQYQICMFDSNGNTGGCQAIYTVYANSTTPPTCANFTMPASTLSVKSEAAQGTLSMYGWVNSCSDMRVTPLGGTPPFTFTVAPALHPPLNITSHDMSPINWTVALSWASPFFVSLVDSTGLSWSNGPLHSGNGETNCLSGGLTSSHNPVIPVGITVGAALGGVALGGVIFILITYLMRKRRAEHDPFISSAVEIHPYTYLTPTSPPASATPILGHQQQLSTSSGKLQPQIIHHQSDVSTTTLPREYAAEPFNYDGSSTGNIPQIQHSASVASVASVATGIPRDAHPNADLYSRSASGLQEGGSQVYVIHHDSGRAPVSVITSPGTELVELPPGYSREYLNTPTASQRRSAKSPVSNRSRS